MGISWAILSDVFCNKLYWKANYDGNGTDFVVSTVPADGLAPLGTRPSARTMMTKCGSCTWLAQKGLTLKYFSSVDISWPLWKIESSKNIFKIVNSRSDLEKYMSHSAIITVLMAWHPETSADTVMTKFWTCSDIEPIALWPVKQPWRIWAKSNQLTKHNRTQESMNN